MDSPELDEIRHREALVALQRINRVSGTAESLWREIARVCGTQSPLRILDIACGGGDVTLALERRARRAGVAVEVQGCDMSEVAIRHARERAEAAGSGAQFFRLDALREPLPTDFDVVCSTLFLHHLDEDEAESLLRSMAASARRMAVIQDLVRSRIGYALAYLAVRVLTRSEVARFDGPVSVQGAFTVAEAAELARRADLEVSIRRCWPQRFSLVWQRS